MRIFVKIFAILLLLAALGGGAYTLYRLFSGALETTAPVATPTSSAAQAVSLLIKALSSQKIFDYWIDSASNAIYLVTPDGKIFRTFGDGREEEVAKQTLPGLHRVEPSSTGALALARFNYPGVDSIALFDTAARSWVRLPEGVFAAAFNPAGQLVAYLRRVNSRTALSVLTLATGKTAEIAALAASDGDLRWVGDTILLVPPPSSQIRTPALAYDTVKKTVRFVDAGAMSISDAQSGNGLRMRAANGASRELFLSNAALTTDFRRLSFVTIPSKCAFSGQTLYCGIPKDFPARASLPDDYLKEKFLSSDTIVTFRVDTGTTDTLFLSNDDTSPVDAIHLAIKGKQLLFKNRYDERLYAFDLPQEKK